MHQMRAAQAATISHAADNNNARGQLSSSGERDASHWQRPDSSEHSEETNRDLRDRLELVEKFITITTSKVSRTLQLALCAPQIVGRGASF